MDRLPPLAASTPQPAEQNRVETHQLTRKQRRDKKKTEREQKKAEQALNSVRTNILQNPQQLQAALPPHLKGFGTDDPGGWWQAKKIEAYVKNLKPEFVTPLVSTKKLSQKAYTAQIKKVMARELF
ncbi:MAG: hypothetical protein OXC48_04070, partial [Endozoicomonadaceae bacterium]|nr:hypothetical protein [Endozoicomonadaceae bacterium]